MKTTVKIQTWDKKTNEMSIKEIEAQSKKVARIIIYDTTKTIHNDYSDLIAYTEYHKNKKTGNLTKTLIKCKNGKEITLFL